MGRRALVWDVVEILVGVDGDIGRLCGRCICASCSGRVSSINYTFLIWSNFGFLSPDHFLLQTCFISNSNSNQDSSCSPSTKPARACDASYDTVFRVIHPLQLEELLRISIMNLINLIQSHRFHIFHRGCLCLHYLLHENTMHWTLAGITSNEVVEVEWGCAIRKGLVSE